MGVLELDSFGIGNELGLLAALVLVGILSLTLYLALSTHRGFRKKIERVLTNAEWHERTQLKLASFITLNLGLTPTAEARANL